MGRKFLNYVDELSNLFRVYILITKLPWSRHFVNKTLNSHVGSTRLHENFCAMNCLLGHLVMMRMIDLLQASDEFESKITPHATAPSLALAPS